MTLTPVSIYILQGVIYDSGTAQVKLLWIKLIKQLRLSTHMYAWYSKKNIYIFLLNVQNGLRALF